MNASQSSSIMFQAHELVTSGKSAAVLALSKENPHAVPFLFEYAVEQGNFEIVQELLKNGYRDSENKALYKAIERAEMSLASVLLNDILFGAEPTQDQHDFFEAVSNNTLHTSPHLMVPISQALREAVFCFAAGNGSVKDTVVFVEQGGICATENSCESLTHFALQYAALLGNDDVVEYLLVQGFKKYTDGALYAASKVVLTEKPEGQKKTRYLRCIALLLQEGANQMITRKAILEKTLNPVILFHETIHDSNLLALFLRYCKDVDIADHFGNTALHKACTAGNFESVRLLVAANALLSATNHAGKTPLDYAVSQEAKTCISLLTVAGAKGSI